MACGCDLKLRLVYVKRIGAACACETACGGQCTLVKIPDVVSMSPSI